MGATNQTSSTTKNQGGHRKAKGKKGSAQTQGYKPNQTPRSVNPQLGDIRTAEQVKDLKTEGKKV